MARLERKTRLHEQAVDGAQAAADILAILQLERGEARNIVAYPGGRARESGQAAENRIGLRNVHVFETVVWLPQFLPQRQPVSSLHIECLAVGGRRAEDRFMLDVGELSNQFGRLALPDDVSGLDPLARYRPDQWIDFVAINRPADLQAVREIGFDESIGQPGAVVVDVSEITAAADDGTPAVAEAHVVIEIQAARGERAFGERTDKMNRDKAAAELNHLWTADGGLEPGAVVERGVPVVDRRVVSAE